MRNVWRRLAGLQPQLPRCGQPFSAVLGAGWIWEGLGSRLQFTILTNLVWPACAAGASKCNDATVGGREGWCTVRPCCAA